LINLRSQWNEGIRAAFMALPKFEWELTPVTNQVAGG
jgi:hypothetical protein